MPIFHHSIWKEINYIMLYQLLQLSWNKRFSGFANTFSVYGIRLKANPAELNCLLSTQSWLQKAILKEAWYKKKNVEFM